MRLIGIDRLLWSLEMRLKLTNNNNNIDYFIPYKIKALKIFKFRSMNSLVSINYIDTLNALGNT